MFCKKCGKYVLDEQRFCPNCGEPVHINTKEESDLGLTKVIPDLDEDAIRRIANAEEPKEDASEVSEEDFDFDKEIQLEDGTAKFDFPVEEEIMDDFELDEEGDFENDSDYEDEYDDETDDDVDDDMERIKASNQNKKLNIIAIGVSVFIVIAIVIAAIVLTKGFGSKKEEETTVVETTTEETTTEKETVTEEETEEEIVTEEPEPETEAPVETEPETEAPVETEPETEAPVETEPETEAPVETEPETEQAEIPTDDVVEE